MIQIQLSKIEKPLLETVNNEPQFKDLFSSVCNNGVLVPITCRENGDSKYTIIDGRQRYLASILAGKESIPVEVVTMTQEQLDEHKRISSVFKINTDPKDYAKHLLILLCRE